MIPYTRGFLVGLLAVALMPLTGWAQAPMDSLRGAAFTQVTRPVAQITQRGAINRLMNELIITPRIPRDSVSRIEVIDVTENGYGPDDLVVVYPSGETFNIQPGMITERVADIMSSWRLESEFQYDGALIAADSLRPDTAQAGASQSDSMRAGAAGLRKPAQYSITADLLKAVQRNYAGDSLSVLLERTDRGLTVEMWNYDESKMQFEPPDMGPPDTVRVRDMVYVVRSDSVVYDVVYINKTVEETTYIPEEGPVSSAPPPPESTPGAGREQE